MSDSDAKEDLGAILASALAGESADAQRLLLHHYSYIEAIARRSFNAEVAEHYDLEDLVQESLVAIFRGLQSFDPDKGRFQAWLESVIENKIADLIRRQRRTKHGGNFHRVQLSRSPEDSIQAVFEWVAGDYSSVGRYAERREFLQAIRISLAGLPADQRQAVDLHYFQLVDISEIAELLNRSPGAIRSLLHRAREQLRTSLGSASDWLSRQA